MELNLISLLWEQIRRFLQNIMFGWKYKTNDERSSIKATKYFNKLKDYSTQRSKNYLSPKFKANITKTTTFPNSFCTLLDK